MNMTPRQNEPVGRLVGRMDALADPIRLRLLRLLERHELGVAELCEVLQLPQSTVSRHLKQLADHGWLINRRSGTSNLYRMDGANLDAGAKQLWRAVRDEAGRGAAARQDQLRLARRLEERRAKSRSFFAGAAGSWEALRTQLYGDGFGLDALLALLPSEWTVADLGAGTGQLAAALAPHVARVIGIDQSEAMLTAARRRVNGAENVELLLGTLEELPLDDAACDAALMVLALTYVAEPRAAVVEAARVIRPGGTLVVVDLLPHDREEFRRELGQHWLGFEPEDISTLLGGAGFAGARVRALPPAPEAKGPALFLAAARRPLA